jgi:hypothetical protein
MKSASGLSAKMSDNASEEIASVHILTTAQKQQVLDDPTVITKNIIPDHVANYKQDQQRLIDLRTELEESQKDNSDYANQIAELEHDLASANTTIHILQAAVNQTSIPTAKPIELPHPPEFSGDHKELLNVISKVRSKLTGESSQYTNDQHKLCYVYGFLKGNVQNQIQPYILPDKIKLDNVEALISILEAAFGDPDQVGTASMELDKVTQGNKEFSQYYAEFQRVMAILDYNSNAKKTALKHGLSGELQTSLVYQAEEPQDFEKLVDLCMKLDYQIRTHAAAMKCHTTPAPPRTGPASNHPSAHRTSTNSGNYGAAPIDLSASQKAQNQRQHDEHMAKGLCLYGGSANHFKSKCPTLAANNSRKVRLTTAEVSTTPTEPTPASEPSSGKE